MKYIVEHMEDEVSEWVNLEYSAIAEDVGKGHFYLTSVKEGVEVPAKLLEKGLVSTSKDITQFAEIDSNFDPSKVILLDPSASEPLKPEDGDRYEYFLFGGILGDHPPRDRTAELRKHGYAGRHLGKTQMTTDTAVRVTQLVCKEGKQLEEIDYIDFPELRFNKNESVEMPFRYVKLNGKPIMPQGMFELIREDTGRSLDDFL